MPNKAWNLYISLSGISGLEIVVENIWVQSERVSLREAAVIWEISE